MKLRESQTLVLPRAGKTLDTKTDKFWYIRYISGLEKAQELKISHAKDKIFIYTLSKIQTYMYCILGDMIPPN